MSEIRFSSKEHEKFFYQMLAKCGKHDSYYSSFFYCVGISEDTRNHVDRIVDSPHRITTLMDCDNILVLEHGKVLQRGTPQELLRQPGLFRQIYDMQMSIGEEEPA